MRIAVYPGSFDPITYGHLDVVRRATEVFDRLVVAVLVNTRKVPAATADERVRVIREAVRDAGLDEQDRVLVTTFEGLTVDYARRLGARHIVRGLRAVSDFESELQMAHLNQSMAPEIDTVFFMTAVEHAYLSSSLVREIAAFGGDVSAMVPESAALLLRRRAAAG
jgi:pantetheine-phosphate adenylyltransferase